MILLKCDLGERMKNITIRLDEKLIEDLKRIAKADKRSLSGLIRLILAKGTKGA